MALIHRKITKEKSITTVLFDLDGTLISSKSRFVDPIVEPLYRFRDEIPLELIDTGIREVIELMKDKSTSRIPIILWNIGKTLELSFTERLKYLYQAKKCYNMKRDEFELNDNAEFLINELSQNYKLGIVTSSPRKDIEKLKAEYPIFEKISTIITRDEVHHLKPHPEGLLKACSILGVDVQEAIYIGDLPTDLIAAKDANMANIGFLGEFSEYTHSLLQAEYPDFLISNLIEIFGILEHHTHNMKINNSKYVLR